MNSQFAAILGALGLGMPDFNACRDGDLGFCGTWTPELPARTRGQEAVAGVKEATRLA